MPEIISRAEAKARGLKRYFTGKLCCNGHLCERRVDNWNCLQCENTQRRRQYAANPEKNREREQRRWNDPIYREKKKASQRAYYRRNRSKVCEINRKWRSSNSEKVREKNREYAKRYQDKNREYYRAYARTYSTKVRDLIAVLRKEMPDLLKEFGL